MSASIRSFVCDGLLFPEGPVWTDEGLLVVEVARGTVTRVRPEQDNEVVAHCGDGPNGAAIGTDGGLYVCCNGGSDFVRTSAGWLLPTESGAAAGSLKKVDLLTGEVSTLYEGCGEVHLSSPNDIVVDPSGGLYFTDMGHTQGRQRTLGSVYWAAPDGSEIKELIHPLETPNGIGMSPDGSRLYVAETITRSIWWWEITGVGKLDVLPRGQRMNGRLLHVLSRGLVLDSMAIDTDGNVWVGAVGRDGGYAVISPQGDLMDFLPMPDPFPTNLCFGPSGSDVAYGTLSATGRVAELAV